MSQEWLLKNGRIIDPASGLDSVSDIAIRDGKIAALGKAILPSDSQKTVDLSGLLVTPGLIDIHLHSYGTLAVLNPDTLGVLSGVTAMVDAGSSGAYNFPELQTLLDDSCETDWFCFLLLQPLGVSGGTGDYHKFVRSISSIPLASMMDSLEKNDRIRGLKIGAFGTIGPDPVYLAKAVARVLKIPLYVHIGDFLIRPPQVTTPQIVRLLEPGDMVTHIYTGVYGGPFTESGLAVEELKEAQARGVVLDIGFGSFNFNFSMARRGLELGILPDTISSDLQNRNVTGPACSLCHVMSIFLSLGMGLAEVIDRVTATPAKALGAEWWRGRIVEGGQADLTVLRLEEGEYSFRDCDGEELAGKRRLVPVKVWKDGRMIECRPGLVEELENWMVEKNEDAPPDKLRCDPGGRDFLTRLGRCLKRIPWELERIHEASALAVEDSEIELRRAIQLVQALCLKRPFPQSMSILLSELGRDRCCEYIQHVLRNGA